MKFKEIDRTASVAWSPASVDNIYLAAGTAAQQLDSTFSTNAALELYQLNVNEPGIDVPVKATYTCENRFHKLVWGNHGIGGENEHPSGIIVGGCDGGVMQVFDANKLFKNEDPVILTKSKHTGPVKALDFNCFRSNLVASGASESEIYIWDLTNPKTAMSPGAKIQPSDDVTDLEWNKQVEHILATTFPGRCVVWDLRKNEPVVKVSDSTSRIRYKCVRWHPEVATQMCLASEDDASPIIQLWDLRYAMSPLKVIQGHQRGILGMSWCAQDPELLVTCGKDSRILCWNPNYPHPGYEMVLDIPTASQWSFDVGFCPKNPIVVSSCTFDGRISIYGLSGGAQQPVTSSKLADSFPGMDMSMSNAPVPAQPTVAQQLRDPPKWFKRPAGVSFAFGGRLVSFQNNKTPSNQPGVPDRISGIVNISQVVTLPSFIERSKRLEEALQGGSLEYYCAEKARVATDSKDAHIWEFLQASFSQNPRQAYVSLLGFNTPEMLTKLSEIFKAGDVDALTNDFGSLGGNQLGGNILGSSATYQNGIDTLPESIPEFSVPTDESVDGKINQAILCGSIDIAVHLCLENERWADALLLASKGSPELMDKAQTKYFQKCQGSSTNIIRAIVRNDLHYLVANCKLDNWKQALATSLTYADNTEFQGVAETLGKRLLESKNDNLTQGALLCFICAGSLNQLVDAWVGKSGGATSPDELQDLVEQVMILKKAAAMWGRDPNITGGSVAGKMIEYASILASQGCLDIALNYLKDSKDPTIDALKDRLQLSLGYTARPTRSQLGPRSRQSSESSTYRSTVKRPSYPTATAPVNTMHHQPTTDFSNLTGPVHPPTAASYNPSGTVNTGYGATSQYSPGHPPPPSTPGLLTYAQPATGISGLPPKPPTAAPAAPLPTLYNPAELAKEMTPSQSHESLQRKSSTGAMPRPPVSNVASGWNDPPPILVKSKTAAQLPSSQQPITHPIFGSAPDPVKTNVPGMPTSAHGGPPGVNPMQSYGTAPPPTSHPPTSQMMYPTMYGSAPGEPGVNSSAPGIPPPPMAARNTNPLNPPPTSFGTAMQPPPQHQMFPGSTASDPGSMKVSGIPPPPTAAAARNQAPINTPPTTFATGMPPPPVSQQPVSHSMFGSSPDPSKVPGMPPSVHGIPGMPPAQPYGGAPPPPTSQMMHPPPPNMYGSGSTHEPMHATNPGIPPPPRNPMINPPTSYGAAMPPPAPMRPY